MSVRRDGVMHGKSLATQRGQNQNRELNSNRRSHFVMCSGFFRPLLTASSGILSHAVKSSNHRLPAGHYVCTQTLCYWASVTDRLLLGQSATRIYLIGTLKTKLNVHRKAVYVRVQLELGWFR